MIYVGLPIGCRHGWGVMGLNIVLELARLRDVTLLAGPSNPAQIDDEIDGWLLEGLLPEPDIFLPPQGPWTLDGPVIQVVSPPEFRPYVPQAAAPNAVGFLVFEQQKLAPEIVERLHRDFRRLAAGSTYCADVLKAHGFANVSTVYHGVDTRLFRPDDSPREAFEDDFVVFSGGKFELRKGQDIVIRAYKVLQDRHPDVMLLNAWHNPWPSLRDSIRLSPLIRHIPTDETDQRLWVNKLLAANGIDIERVLSVGPRTNRLMPRIYHNTDVGIFPNRVEGGTNMVMMEYMACGKPVIASYNSGHQDVVRDQCARLIRQQQPIRSPVGPQLGDWNESNLEETIEHLEWCYQNRGRLKVMGQQAAADMAGFTWKRVAERLLAALDQSDQ